MFCLHDSHPDKVVLDSNTTIDYIFVVKNAGDETWHKGDVCIRLHELNKEH